MTMPHTALRLAAALALLAAALLPPAAAQSGGLEAPGAATPLLVVEPAFPPGVVAPAPGVTIEVLGTVRRDGSFVAQTLQARDGEHPAFVAAVREVIGHWRFLPAVDEASCTATDAPARLFVTFSGSAAAPSISVTRPAATPSTIPRVTDLFNRMRRPSFTGQVEGRVLVLSLIDPDGVSQAVSVRYSSPPGRFDRAVLDHARRTLVDWAPPKPSAAVCTQREYRMCLDPADRDAADAVRHPVCDEPGGRR